VNGLILPVRGGAAQTRGRRFATAALLLLASVGALRPFPAASQAAQGPAPSTYRTLESQLPPAADAIRSGHLGPLVVTTGATYNRVEGLPIPFGFRLELPGGSPVRVEALAIYRTADGLDVDAAGMGYLLQARRRFGAAQSYEVGGGMHSVVEPIERGHLSHLEAALSTLLLGRDPLEHYHREGASAFLRWEPGSALRHVQGELRWERHEPAGLGDPWTIRGGGPAWRPLPEIAQGRLGTLRLGGEVDDRSPLDPRGRGWRVSAHVEAGWQVDLHLPDRGGTSVTSPFVGPLASGELDLRRYLRQGGPLALDLRLVAGGSLTGDPLPPQRQRALGGAGTLPGLSPFELDCGARRGDPLAAGRGESRERRFPYHGCDATILAQTEVRGPFSLLLPGRHSRAEAGPASWGGGGWPEWALILDAGRGWAFDDRGDEPLRIGVGAGVVLDLFGIYAARGASGANLFVRLGRRF
jgi:hypothetical protein